jgi:hypothetical protein
LHCWYLTALKEPIAVSSMTPAVTKGPIKLYNHKNIPTEEPVDDDGDNSDGSANGDEGDDDDDDDDNSSAEVLVET